jgi:hypothetical protein
VADTSEVYVYPVSVKYLIWILRLIVSDWRGLAIRQAVDVQGTGLPGHSVCSVS